MNRRRRERVEELGERGGVSPAAGVAILVLAMLAVGTVSIGRLAAVRSDAQQAADSAVLSAGMIVRNRGMPFNAASRNAAQNIAARNSQLPISFTWTVNESPTAVDVTVQATINVDLPTLIFTGGSRTVQAQASGRIQQTRFDEAERRIPKLALVLDYSGSMTWPFTGDSSGRSAIEVLEDSIEDLLTEDLMVDYGAVFYSSDVFHVIPVSASAPNQIINAMNNYGAGGMTNTSGGIHSGRSILTATENTGYHILLVSDGAPNNGGGFAGGRAAAEAAWNADITIFTLEIRRSGSGAALAQFMTDVAGSPTSRRDPNYHFVATSAAALIDTFRDIVASIICKVGPISPVPSDPSTIHVFLSSGASERVLAVSTDLAADAGIEAFQYFPGDHSVRLTVRACDAVIDHGDEIVVRFDQPFLTD